MNRRKIRDIIDDLFSRHGITSVPINAETLARSEGIEVRKRDFEDTLSGFAYRENGQKIIGVNASHGQLRQRFTIAHELGHLFLDKRDELNYDRKFAVQFRNGLSSEGTNLKEVEANYFAAELLMPEKFLRADVLRYVKEKGALDFEDDQLIQELASRYEVSVQAMTVRLANLRYI